MHEAIPYNTVVLVRAKPGSGADVLARRAVERVTGSCLVFFHGPAVAIVAADGGEWSDLGNAPDDSGDDPVRNRAGISLRVCSAAWQRHSGGQLPPGFEIASLTAFWHAASQADRLISIGQGEDG